MKKLLVEQLREIEEKDNKFEPYDLIINSELVMHINPTEAKLLADELEKYYEPRTDLVGIDFNGDEFEIGSQVYNRNTGSAFHVVKPDDNGQVLLDDDETGERFHLSSEFLTQQKPVPGFDGDFVNKNDVVYIASKYAHHAESAPLLGIPPEEPLRVLKTQHQHPSYKKPCVKVQGLNNHVTAYAKAKWLTKIEPDSLEKIESDAKKSAANYWNCIGTPCGNCPASINGQRPYERYNADEDCLMAKTLDLLHRQRVVLGCE